MSSELVKDVIGSDSMARVRKQKFTLDVAHLFQLHHQEFRSYLSCFMNSLRGNTAPQCHILTHYHRPLEDLKNTACSQRLHDIFSTTSQ
jgi:hypothetical protein